ncbi:TPA: hypothetical protein VBO02_001706 [Streptococcus agalactiae]|uniref:hypothetical protein n=1 Tax=Streptococcus agalactiae TaxID=1311 RepID=UPI0002D52FCA|nr:hypothetical protein [Streptococcus agalactiae]QBX20664.1 hypothetical protein Javan53_0005 [Streptococcus phage Javan53]EPW55059.1 hypothetical protein SAG0083_05255 [Streptococcus agalactiae LMG 15084]OCM86732.1 hypothetical protein AX251_00125 [Streptococcus agalactiae]CCW39573.1 hypothetical protein MSA_7120 [Streptococcus agalactiae ILRI005]SUN19399.1 Uncharacterised protein [Streptococcus agalactiae]
MTDIESQRAFIANIKKMFSDIEEAYAKEKDPIARCELAIGYLKLGSYLEDFGILSTKRI